MIAATPVKYRSYYALGLVLLLLGLQTLPAQTEAQAGEDILLLQNQSQPNQYIEIRAGDKLIYPEMTDRGPRKKRVRIAAIQDSSLVVKETPKAEPYTVQLADYPYVNIQRRPVRRTIRVLGFTAIGILLSGLIGSALFLAFSTSSYAGLGAVILVYASFLLSIPFIAATLVLLFFLWRKLWMRNWKIRKTRRRNVVKKVVPAPPKK